MSPMLNRVLKALLPPLVLGVALAAAYVMYLNRPPVETQTPVVAAPAVRVQQVAFESVDLTVSSQGTVQPRTSSQLVPEIAGTVINVSPAFAVGGFFEEGTSCCRSTPTTISRPSSPRSRSSRRRGSGSPPRRPRRRSPGANGRRSARGAPPP